MHLSFAHDKPLDLKIIPFMDKGIHIDKLTGKEKLPSLNGLRGMSVVFVIIGHFSMQYGIFNDMGDKKYLRPFIKIIQDGHMGVNIFFVISGFLITLLLLNEELKSQTISLKSFYLRRTLRIFPAYFFLLFAYFIAQLLGFIYIENSSWLTSITYTKYFNSQQDWYTGHIWSLSVEEHFYLCWPFIFILGDRLRKYTALALVIMVPFVRLCFHFYPISWVNDLTIFFRIDAIAIGCVFALYKKELFSFIKAQYWKPIFYIALVTLLLLPYFRYVPGFKYIIIAVGTTSGPIANVCIVFIVMHSIYFSRGLWYRFFNSRVMNFLGLLSYSIYLWQQIFTYRSHYWFSSLPINLFFIFIFAILSYYLVEKPFLRLKERY